MAVRADATAVVHADGHEARVLATVRSLEAQRGVQVETLLVADTANLRGRTLLDDLATRPRVRVVPGSFATRAAARAAGAQAAEGELLLFPHPGDRLAPAYMEQAIRLFGADPALALVSSWVVCVGAGADRLQVPGPPSLAALLADPWALHDATVVRRADFEAAGGLDGGLPALELYDAFLRLLEAGKGARLIEEPLLHQAVGPDAAARRDLDPETHAAAFERVFEKHRGAFQAATLHVLAAKEAILTAAAQRHAGLSLRRAETQRQIDELKAEAARLAAALAAAGDAGIDWGELRRVRPLDPDWGYSRGTPVDRVYIERFLAAHALDIQGDVLEVQESDYARRFGGERVSRADVLDIVPENARAGIVADLRAAPSIPADSYDCVILTQTAHVVDDVRSVLAECRRILKPGGVLLATFPAASRVCLEYGPEGDHWRLTEAGARLLAGESFGGEHVEAAAYGNVLTNAAFLYGAAAHELRPEELDAADPYYPLLVGVRATKPGVKATGRRGARGRAGVVLLYHRVATTESDAYGLAVAPEAFRAQMAHLRSACTVLPLAELIERARRDDLPPRAAAVTFDDGYLDNLGVASPVLVELGLPATFFVTGEGLAGREFWWDVLERTLLSAAPAPDELKLTLGGEPRSFAVATSQERAECHAALYARLLGSAPQERDAVLQALVRWSGQALPVDGERRPMSREELRRLAARPGHEVGAHGFSHRALVHLDEGEKRHELVDGLRAVEEALGLRPRHLAYAFGAVDDASAAAARAAGFEAAVTCEPEAVGAGTDPFRVGRFEVTAQSLEGFASFLDGAFARVRSKVPA
ncbi:MAG TPA: polysaccharide deacetylase family protein [Vicinamibacteria bacterium]|nr:polysaccharide deacetylase family protein [Vicinamibacteria bacterium]